MTRITNPESIRQRLQNLQKKEYPNIPPNVMLLLYAQQGFLARIDASGHAEQFVLKGALSLFSRYREASRPTQDIDLASRGFSNDPQTVAAILREVCTTPFPDGLLFDPESIQVSPINEAFDYPGVNAQLRAGLGSSVVTLQIDFSFGNVITPEAVQLAFPQLLLPEAVAVMAYPLETVVTEKFAALVEIGLATTRMKDLYDLQLILPRESFEAELMRQALERSFEARGTPQEAIPFTLSAEFAENAELNRRWQQYLRRTGFTAPALPEVMRLLRAFYEPLLLTSLSGDAWNGQEWH